MNEEKACLWGQSFDVSESKKPQQGKPGLRRKGNIVESILPDALGGVCWIFALARFRVIA